MTDIPIIFSAPMVLALLDSRKTMTRRLAHLPPRVAIQVGDGPIEPLLIEFRWQKAKPGDRLWVRETWRPVHSGDPARGASYRAGFGADNTKWCSPIHMPRWASRLTLILQAVKIERLQDIDEDDARAEGWPHETSPKTTAIHIHPTAWFEFIWRDLHGAKSWAENPDVVALTFRVIKQNIDLVPKEQAA